MEINSFNTLYSRPIASGSRNEWDSTNSEKLYSNIDDNVFYPDTLLGTDDFCVIYKDDDLAFQTWKAQPINYNGDTKQIYVNTLIQAYQEVSPGNTNLYTIIKLNNVWHTGIQTLFGQAAGLENTNVSYPSASSVLYRQLFDLQVPSGYFNDVEIGLSVESLGYKYYVDALWIEANINSGPPLYINSSYPTLDGGIPLFVKNNTYNHSGLIPIHEQGHISLAEPMKLSIFDYGEGGYWPPVNSTIPPKFIYNYSTRQTSPIPVDVGSASRYNNWSSIGTYSNGKSAARWSTVNTDVSNMLVTPINSIIIPADALNGSKQSYALTTVPRFEGPAKNIKIKFTAVFYDTVTEYIYNNPPYFECAFGPHEKRGWLELVNYPKRSGVFSGDPFRTGAGDPVFYTGYQTSYNAYFEDIYGYVRSCGSQVPNLENYSAVNAWRDYTVELSELNSYEILWDDFRNLQLAFSLEDINLTNVEDPTNIHRYTHGFYPYLGFGRIKSATVSFDVPTMPLYVEGGTWETITVPLFGFNDDGTSKSGISLYTDGHGFPASGLFPIYVSGIPGANLSVPMYAHNFASFESGVPIYTSGMYQSELYTPLYTNSREPNNSSVPLYVDGITQSTLTSPLYSLGPVPYSGALSMFSVGPRPLDSGLSLYTTGPTPINSGALLYTFNEFGERATQKGLNLYTQSAYFSNSGLSLYTHGVFSYDFMWQPSGWPKPYSSLYINGLYYESSGKFPLYTKTSYDGTSNSFDSFGSTKLYIKQTGISGVRTSTLYIHNEGEVYSGGQARPLYVHSPQPIYSIDGSIGLTLKNSVSGVSLGSPLYTQHLRDISIFDPLYFELDDNAIPIGQGKTLMVYNNLVGQSTPLYVRVSEPKESGISVYLEGTNRANSGTPLSTLGIGNWADSISVYTHGF